MLRKSKKLIYNGVIISLLLICIIYVVSNFVHLGNVEFTDNAYVNQHITPVNSRIQGFIKEIKFDEYKPVKKGDTLVIIEDAEFRLHVAQAQAALQNATAGKSATRTGIETTQSNIFVTDAAIKECKIQLDNAKREWERYKQLLAENAVTQQQYDNINTAYKSIQAKYEQLIQSKHSTTLVKNEQSHRMEQNDANIDVAKASLELALLNLSYTIITAPCDGVLCSKSINVGELVQPGQTLVEIVDSGDIWITANYRETQLKNISEGASVNIEADAIPGIYYTGVVESISNATGSAVSLIPQDNATGNFVKVEQRIPVRIKIVDTDSSKISKLRAGLSVECEIKY